MARFIGKPINIVLEQVNIVEKVPLWSGAILKRRAQIRLINSVTNIEMSGMIMPEKRDRNSFLEKLAVMFRNILQGKAKFNTIFEKISTVSLLNH